MKTRHKVLLSCMVCLLCLILGTVVGSVQISVTDVFSIVAHKLFGRTLPPHISSVTVSILWRIRLPRLLMSFMTGAALAVSGTVMQSVLRNPLASSYTLGVSSGASLAAAIVLLSGFHLPLLGGFTLPFCGFLGGLATVFFAIGLSLRFDANLENHTIILTGMVLSLFVNAMLTIATSMSGEHLKQLVFWQMGSFNGQSWENCGMLLPVLLLGCLLLSGLGRELDLLTFGDEQALSAGVDLKRVKFLLISLAALLAGASVCFVGIIGFIDLIAPHVVRRIFGSRHAVVVPMSALFGGVFMCLADLLARTVMIPEELPVGAVTALVGAPFFTWVFFRRRKERI